MRHVLFVAFGLIGLGAAPAMAADDGLPITTFVQSWTALPTGHFTQADPRRRFTILKVHAEPSSEARIDPLLEDALASARDKSERRNLALNEITTTWDQQKRSAFQRLRDAEIAYAGTRDDRDARFVATLMRLMEGIGRSAANDNSASDTLDHAYATTLSREAGDGRVAAEREQSAWRTYRDAFAAFVDLQAPDSADSVTAELDRQRAREFVDRSVDSL